MTILQLTLKKKWFDMIRSGAKTEEYREIKDYWDRRLLTNRKEIEWQVWDEMLGDMQNPFIRHKDPGQLMEFFEVEFKRFEVVRFRNGYRKDSPAFDIDFKGIEIKLGKEEWGAEPGKVYFVLMLGKIKDQLMTETEICSTK